MFTIGVWGIGCFIITAVLVKQTTNCCYSYDAAGVNSVPSVNHLVTQHRLEDHHSETMAMPYDLIVHTLKRPCSPWYRRVDHQSDGDHALHTNGPLCKTTLIVIVGQHQHRRVMLQCNRNRPDHEQIINQHVGVSVHPHWRVVLKCDGNNDLTTDGS